MKRLGLIILCVTLSGCSDTFFAYVTHEMIYDAIEQCRAHKDINAITGTDYNRSYYFYKVECIDGTIIQRRISNGTQQP